MWSCIRATKSTPYISGCYAVTGEASPACRAAARFAHSRAILEGKRQHLRVGSQRVLAGYTLDGPKINITTAVVGDGGGSYYIPTPDMTEIKNVCAAVTYAPVWFVPETSPSREIPSRWERRFL